MGTPLRRVVTHGPSTPCRTPALSRWLQFSGGGQFTSGGGPFTCRMGACSSAMRNSRLYPLPKRLLRCCTLPKHCILPSTMMVSREQSASHSSMLCDVSTTARACRACEHASPV
eukprot:9071856-Pyramimonas_sp.AAC.1